MQRVALTILPDAKMPCGFPQWLAGQLVPPPSPVLNLELPHPTRHVDITLLRPSFWPTAGASPPAELQGFTNFLCLLVTTFKEMIT